MSNIKLVQSVSKWKIYNQGSLELCSESHELYLDLMIKSFGDIFSKPLNILIVGGGDMQIYNYLCNTVDKDSAITLVDPEAGSYKEYEHLYQPGTYDKNIFNNTNTFNTVFSEAFKHAFSPLFAKFDVIIVDCSEDIVKETSEIYCETFLKQLKSLSKSDTEIHFYIPDAVNDSTLKELVESYFTTEVYDTYIPAWEEVAVVVKLKVKPPVMHCHMHADIVLIADTGHFLKTTNSYVVSQVLKLIVNRYCDIKITSHFPFKTGGYSGSFILGESHFNWHSYPEQNLLTLDLYHCNYSRSLIGIFKDIFKNFDKNIISKYTVSTRVFNPLADDKDSKDSFLEEDLTQPECTALFL